MSVDVTNCASCKHSKLCHEVEEAPACCMAGCGCMAYQETARRPQYAATATVDFGGVGATIAQARKSKSKRIQAAGAKIEAQLETLAERLREEASGQAAKRRQVEAKAATTRRIKELQVELAAERAKLKK